MTTLQCTLAIETFCIHSYNQWLSSRALNMTGDYSVHHVTGEKINTECSTQWVSLQLIMINLRFRERSFTLPYLFLWISCSYSLWIRKNTQEKVLSNYFFQLAYVGVQHLAPSTRIHRCSRTHRLESLIRDVHHCVGFWMQMSFSACVCVIPGFLTCSIQQTEIKPSLSAAWSRLNASP